MENERYKMESKAIKNLTIYSNQHKKWNEKNKTKKERDNVKQMRERSDDRRLEKGEGWNHHANVHCPIMCEWWC